MTLIVCSLDVFVGFKNGQYYSSQQEMMPAYLIHYIRQYDNDFIIILHWFRGFQTTFDAYVLIVLTLLYEETNFHLFCSVFPLVCLIFCTECREQE